MRKTLILIPAYNAGSHLPGLLKEIRSVTEMAVLVIDDGSRDNTSEAARANGAEVIRFDENRGKGAALDAGMDLAIQKGYEYVVTLDADGQHSPADLPRFFEFDADIVLGARDFTPGVMPFFRILSNSITSRILSWVTHRDIRDSQCGYRKIRLAFIQSFKARFTRYQYETELLLHVAGRRRGAVINVPIRTIYGDERSHIRHFRDTFQFVAAVLRYLWISK